jgi:TetR/AcrR family acrAB operon transcriptional repressor
MARKTKEDAQKTRETIVDAAIRVFSAQGVSRSTLVEIAREAGVTRGAIYWHFKNKEDLLEALWDDVFSPFEAVGAATENDQEVDPLGLLHKVHLDLFQGLSTNPKRLQMLKILLNNSESEDDQSYRTQLSHFREGQDVLTKVFNQAMSKGQLPQSFNVHLATLATIVFINGLLRKWIMFPGELGLDHEIPALLKLLDQMIRNDFNGS